MFLVGLILILLSSYLYASAFRNILIFYIAFLAQIILNIETLSLFGAICDKNIMLFTILNLIVSLVVFKIKKSEFIKPKIDIKRFINSLKLDNSLLLLFIAFVVFNLITFFLSMTIATVEPDSQTYHFYRALKFVENQSLNHFETNDVRALVMPINSEIIYSWFYALKKNFYGYGLLSYFSYVFAVIAGWKIAEIFKFSYRKRLFSIFIFSAFPSVIIQASSMQTDIVVGALLITSFALFLDNKKHSIFFSALALAIAFGTKSTAVMASLGFFVLLIGYEILIEKNKKLSKFLTFLPFLFLNFIIFSSYNYILNYFHYAHPIANNAALIGHGFWGGFEGFVSNVIHFIFQAFDFCGFKWGFYLNEQIMNFSNLVYGFLGINPEVGCNVPMQQVNILADEQFVGFGILGFLVFLPSVFVSFFKIFKSKNKRTILLFLFALVFLIDILVLCRAMAYMIYSIRFVVAFVALTFLVLSNFYTKKSIIKPLILFFALFYMLLIATHNRRAPFDGVIQNLIKNKFNMEKYQEDYFNGTIITSWELPVMMYDVIQDRYKDVKKVAVVKSMISAMLYLKTKQNENFKVDFLAPSQLSKEKLGQYDLVILEDKVQNENSFAPWEAKVSYRVEGNNLQYFENDKLKCCLVGWDKSFVEDAFYATEQICMTQEYVKKINYKEDYLLKYRTKDLKIDMYFYIKSN